MKIFDKNYSKLISYILKNKPRYSIYSLVVLITDMVSNLGRLILISWFISIFVNRQVIESRQVITLCLVFLLFEFIRVLFRQLYTIEGKKIDDSFLNGNIESVLRKEPHSIISEHFDDKLTQYKFNLTYIGGVSNNFQHFVNLLLFFLNSFVYLLSVIYLLSKLWDTKIIFFLLIILIVGIVIVIARNAGFNGTNDEQKVLFDRILRSEKRRNYFIYNIINNYPLYNVIKTFSIENFFSRKYFLLNNDGLKDSIDYKHNNDSKIKLFYQFQLLLFLLVYILLFFNIFINLEFVVFMPIYIGIATQFLASSTLAFQSIETLNRIEPYISNIIDFIEFSTENQELVDVCELFSIEFRNVSFKYDGTKNNILKNVNFKIDNFSNFSKIALIGENGSGKSTFIKLLLGIYRPTEGSILINGINIEKIAFDSIIKKLGVLLQDFSFFAGTIEENLMVNTDVQIDKFKLFLNKLSSQNDLANRLDNKIVSLSEDNVNLSGGEKQRLALARILLDTEKDFFILDEPTSAFDLKSEKNFFYNLRELVSNKPVLVVTHNLSLIKDFDRVLFIKSDGNIVDSYVPKIYDLEEFKILLNKDISNRML